MMHQRLGAGDCFKAKGLCRRSDLIKAKLILPVIAGGHEQIDLPAKAARQLLCGAPPFIRAAGQWQRVRRMQQKHQPLGPIGQVAEHQLAAAFVHPQPAFGYQPAQVCPAAAALRQGGQSDPFLKDQLRGRDETGDICNICRRWRRDMRRARRPMFGRGLPRCHPPRNVACFAVRAYNAGHRVFIGNRQCRHAQKRRPRDIFFGMRGAFEKAEIRGGRQFNKHKLQYKFLFCSFPLILWDRVLNWVKFGFVFYKRIT